jgi:hypothetical protein
MPVNLSTYKSLQHIKGETMVRKTLILAAAFFFVALFTGSSMAEEKSMGMYIELDGLANIQNLDEQQSTDKFSGPIIIDFDDSWGIQARGGIVVNKYLSAEAMIEYIAPFEAMTGSDSDELDVVNLGLNGKLTYPLYEGKLIPYALVGVSAMNVFEEIKYGGLQSKTSDWGVAVRGGGGPDYYFSPELSCRVEGAYVAGLGDVDHVRYTTLSAGVAYHF